MAALENASTDDWTNVEVAGAFCELASDGERLRHAIRFGAESSAARQRRAHPRIVSCEPGMQRWRNGWFPMTDRSACIQFDGGLVEDRKLAVPERHQFTSSLCFHPMLIVEPCGLLTVLKPRRLTCR